MSNSVTESRRSFLGGLLVITATSAIPAGVRAETLPILYADGIGDDTAALQAFAAGRPFRTLDGFSGVARDGLLCNARVRITNTIHITASDIRMLNIRIDGAGIPEGQYALVWHNPGCGLSDCTAKGRLRSPDL